MAELVSLLMLFAASVGSMAFGILAAYGVLRVAFSRMRPRSKAERTRPEALRAN